MILWPRQQYHFGPGRISMYLDSYHQLKRARLACGGSCTERREPDAGLTALPTPRDPLEALRESSALATSCRLIVPRLRRQLGRDALEPVADQDAQQLRLLELEVVPGDLEYG